MDNDRTPREVGSNAGLGPSPERQKPSLARRLLDVACRIRVGETLYRDDELVDAAAHELVRLTAENTDDGWPKLTKPARVGNGTFGVGVSSRLVVEAAQRQHIYAEEEGRLTDEQAREHERNRRRLWDMMNGPVVHTDMKEAIEQAVQAERHACSIAVWMTLQDALADDADDKGLEGWMREAEARVKARA